MTFQTHPLQRAALYRFFALAFMPPVRNRLVELSQLANELKDPDRDKARSVLAEADTPDIEGIYHALIGAQKNCRCCESDYLREAAGNKGVVLGDIAGFYHAFGFEQTAELREVPDHVSIELSFLSFLALKESYALHRGATAQAELCRDAEYKFLAEHLDRWLSLFTGSLAAAARDGFYCSLALYADEVLGPLLFDARERLPKPVSFAADPPIPHPTQEFANSCQGCFAAQDNSEAPETLTDNR